jgi:GT2 family glycosyltransferase
MAESVQPPATVLDLRRSRAGPENQVGLRAGPPSLCMINYNGVRYLDRSLAALEPLRASVREVLLIDDASTDASVELVQTRFQWVRVLSLPRNAGAAAARNAALDAAQGDRVLIVDNDVYVPPNCVDRLSQVLDEHPAAGVAMARIVPADHPDRIQFDAAEPHFIGLMSLGPADQPLSEAPTAPRPVGSMISSCFLVDRSRLGDLYFDEDFFVYLEDHDFGLRVRGRGLEVISVPDVVCLHGEGTEDISIRLTGTYTKVRVFCFIRNRWLLIAKNYQVRTLVLLAPALALFEVVQLAGALKKGWLRQWLAAAGWMLSNVGKVAAKRRAVQRPRVLPDRELLRGGPIPFRRELAADGLERLGRVLLDAFASANWSLVKRWI